MVNDLTELNDMNRLLITRYQEHEKTAPIEQLEQQQEELRTARGICQ